MKNFIAYLSWIDSVAGGVWILLSLIMIGVLYQIYRKRGSANPYFFLGLFLLIIVWLYPLYTSFFDNMEIGMAGNLITLLVTIAFMLRLKSISKRLSQFMIPQVIWLFVATVYVGLMLIDKR